mgnify:CR=1 FL=1
MNDQKTDPETVTDGVHDEVVVDVPKDEKTDTDAAREDDAKRILQKRLYGEDNVGKRDLATLTAMGRHKAGMYTNAAPAPQPAQPTTFDFGDGNGPVPAHRHPNGGGWVADTATVDDTAYVGLDARVFGQAKVQNRARVEGTAWVFGMARIKNDAWLNQNARVSGKATVQSRARVYGNAVVTDAAFVGGCAWVFDDALVGGNSLIIDQASVFGQARITNGRSLRGRAMNSGPLPRRKLSDPTPTADAYEKPVHTEFLATGAVDPTRIPVPVLQETVDRGERAVRRNLRAWPQGKALKYQLAARDGKTYVDWYWADE